jgi:hypothetical protein
MTATRSIRDMVVAGLGAVIAVVCLSAALRPGGSRVDARDREVVARISVAIGTLQVRPAETLGWQTAQRGEAVHDADALYVPPGGEVKIVFTDGTVLELDERSLVVIEPRRAEGRSVTLRQGSVAGLTGSVPLTLETKNGRATLPAGAEARVDLTGGRLDVSVTKGKATVVAKGKTADVAEGTRVNVMEELVLLPGWPVTLLAPEAQHRVLFRGTPPPITLTWKDAPKGARLQVAKDRLFAFLSREAPAEAGSLVLSSPTPGVTWWRLVDATGTALSEARRFSLVEDLAPAARLPRPGEVVLAPPGSKLEFAWTPLPGISRYRLEVSASQGFEPRSIDETVAGSQVKLTSTLPEGIWFWRVRAADDAVGETLPSETSRFRVIHKGIPDAPELLNPEIEVTPARTP